MRPQRLRFDLDGVVVDFFTPVFETHFQRTGVKFRQEDLKQHEISTLVGKEVYAEMEAQFNEPGFFAGLKPYPGAVEVVNALLDAGHEIEVVTSPTMIYSPIVNRRVINGRVAAEKIDWVTRHIPRLAANVTITKNKAIVDGDALIDDAEHNVVPWAKAHPKGLAIVIARPWNESMTLPSNSVRCALAEVEGVLLLKADDEELYGEAK